MFRSSKSILAASAAALILISASGAPSTARAAAAPIQVTLDGKKLPLDAQPIVASGRTLVPYSSIVQSLGGKASWSSSTRTVTATSGSDTVKLTAGSATAYINGKATKLDAAPVIQNGRTFVPLRLITEAFGKWVSWSQSSRTVAISSKLTLTTSTGPFTLNKRPQRIVTLSSSDTEMIYALGGTVVGRPTAMGAVNPPEAASAVEVGSTHGILFEKLASVKPDLVIASPALASQKPTLEKLGAQVLLNSHNSYDQIKSSLRLYGKLLGKETKAEEIAANMDRTVSSLKKPASKPKALIVYGAPGSFVVALPSSYPGSFLELAGGANVAASFPKMTTMPQYAELSMERIVAANPDLILLIAHGDSAEVKSAFKKQFESNPAWNNLSAINDDQFEILPQNLFAANPGLRAPEAIKTINKLLLQVN
ncbi:ABC transporter substrate-binding protein [Paenibacillus albicereus]|uniref:ABC transporter substrate-binding protein n=1 Tax=Paenibacillus albicereus TaxID=2726185 RepID=A0A6H2GVL3_9BACL|nr:ABC transporter substrate-binding protein [Paenibacillus albicereus]QJC51471.1 ABC transporter substrate-binding protein [Paenibacillus albicereus]